MVEVLVSTGLFVIVFSFMLGTYVTMQKLFPGGINQIYLQSYGRSGLNTITGNIRLARSAVISGGSSSVLTLVLDPNNTYNDLTDDVTIRYTVSGSDITYDPDVAVGSNERILLENVGQEASVPYFQSNGDAIVVTFRVYKDSPFFGLQNCSLSTAAKMRNI